MQQTTVPTAISYYRRWMKLFPDMHSVSAAPLPKILKAWQGLGYYQRARNLHKAAGLMTKYHGGRVPPDAEALRALPGFGPYTTAAVLSIAFGKRAPLIDANVRRVGMRLLALPGEAAAGKDEKIFRFLKRVMPFGRAGDFNQALMELGALVCRSSTPACSLCPVRAVCLACRRNLQDVIPGARRQEIQKIRAVVGVMERRGQVFMQQRPAQGLLAGLWEFPGGKLKKGESFEAALRREFAEELGVRVVSLRHLFSVRHSYTRFRVTLDVWRCDAQPLPREDKTHKWLDPGMVKRYPMPSATIKIFEKLKGSETPLTS